MEDLYVPDTSKPEPRRPRKEFVNAAIALAKERWTTNAAILKAMGYDGTAKNETLRRMEKGQGSDKSARALVKALRQAKVDVSKLPPMYDEDDVDGESWREEWRRAGELLHKYALPIYETTTESFRDIVNALERREKAERDLGRAT